MKKYLRATKKRPTVVEFFASGYIYTDISCDVSKSLEDWISGVDENCSCILRCGVYHLSSRRYYSDRGRLLAASPSTMHLPLRLCNFHKKLLVLYGDPARKRLHSVLKVAVEENVASPVNQSRTGGMKNIETTTKRAFLGC